MDSGLERFRLGLTTTAGVSWIDILYALAISLPDLPESPSRYKKLEVCW